MAIPLESFTKDGIPVGELSLIPKHQKIANVLDKLEDGTMISTFEVSKLVDFSTEYLTHSRTSKALAAYRFHDRATIVWWGNRNTIREYTARMKEWKGRQSGDNNK